MKRIAYIYDQHGKVVSVIDRDKLKKFILKKVSTEFSNMVEDCYYPKISTIFKELMHLTNSTEAGLKAYSKEKYNNPKWKLIHDPQTTLLILIVQEFLKANDVATAMATFHLFALRYYSNLMHRSIKYCNPDYFRTALNTISHRHLFSTKKTIGSSVLYLSQEVYKRYDVALKRDDSDQMIKMIMELRHRISQSVNSFASKYYEASESKELVKSEEEQSETQDMDKRRIASNIAKDLCIFGRVVQQAINEATTYTKFNRQIAKEYADAISQSKYSDQVKMIIYLLMKDINSLDVVGKPEYLDYIKRHMAVKVSKKPIYFKKSVTELHNIIVMELGYSNWFNQLSAQSQATSRNFIAYYLAFVLKSYV